MRLEGGGKREGWKNTPLIGLVDCWKGPKRIPTKGTGKNTLKVKKKGKFRVFSGCFQAILRVFQGVSGCFQGVSGCFQGVFPHPGIPFGPFQDWNSVV